MTDETQRLRERIAALEETVRALQQRVEQLQARGGPGLGLLDSVVRLEESIARRTHELERAKQRVEELVAERTLELRRKSEELERANRLLQEMDRMKTHLLQNVSHELKTPLVSIRGYAELLRYRFSENLDEQQRQFLEIILRNADRLNRLVEDLVRASEVVRGVSPLKVERVDVAAMVLEVLEELRPQAERYRVTVHHDVPPQQVIVEGDRLQLRQVVSNLVGNAIKFCDGRPVREVFVELEGLEEDVVLEVRDTGIGIPKERIPRIFDRFYQVDSSGTRRYGGMGLGLSLVKQVVESHDGAIFVESEPKRGTRFVVRLPRRLGHGADSTEAAPVVEHEEAPIFVVEDQEESAVFYTMALEQLGYRSLAFTKPREALAALAEARPRLILLDLAMPEMSGVEFLARLDELPPGERPAVVLITARGPEEVVRMDLGTRVDSVLYKPFGLEVLRRTVERILGAADPRSARE